MSTRPPVLSVPDGNELVPSQQIDGERGRSEERNEINPLKTKLV
jgi:hypothetical protein